MSRGVQSRGVEGGAEGTEKGFVGLEIPLTAERGGFGETSGALNFNGMISGDRMEGIELEFEFDWKGFEIVEVKGKEVFCTMRTCSFLPL